MWEELNKQMLDLLVKGDLQAAQEVGQKALEQAENALGPDDSESIIPTSRD